MMCVLAVSCATRGVKPPSVPPAVTEFMPVSFISPIHVESGAYGSLYASDSYAIWANPEVAALKKAQAAESGEAVDPKLETLGQAFTDNFLVFECHLSSAFGDTSMGYDAVGLRSADVYLLTADGRTVRPIQMAMAGPVRETPQGALKKFERATLVVFPRKDVASGAPTVNSRAPAARLVIEAVQTKFYFEWASTTAPSEPTGPTMEDRLRAVKLGFNEFYRKLLAGAHTFD
jgi:hypothetical protein